MATDVVKPMKDTHEEPKRVSFNVALGEEVEEEEEMTEKELSYELFQPPPEEEKNVGTIIRDTFGFYKKRPAENENPEKAGSVAEGVVHRYTLTNSKGVEVRVMTLGATILSVRMPSNKGVMGDVILGYDTLQDYMNEEKNEMSFGAMLGRFSSFISNAQIKIGRNDYCLSTNVKGQHHTCGGFKGFDKALWDSYVAYDRVIMSHVSPDGDEGYPGTLMVQVSFQLTQNSRLIVNTTATTSKPTILSLGHNLFFNMAGHETGPEGLQDHTLLVNADRFVKINEFTNAPDGELVEVGSSYYDLRVPRPVWKAIKKIPGGGYNNTFCLTKGYPTHSVTFATRLIHPNSGRYLEILSDMPGLYINTGTALPDPDAKMPLEAQTGFKEELEYPQFCRDEKKLEKYAQELENHVVESQNWPRQDPAITKPEIKDEIPETQGTEKDEDEEKVEENEDNGEQQDKPIFDENFLKDEAESEIEEHQVAMWVPPQPISGKKGAQYRKNGAICLITQEYPDNMRFEHFPKAVLKPGEPYSRTTVYKFGVIPMRTDREKYFYL